MSILSFIFVTIASICYSAMNSIEFSYSSSIFSKIAHKNDNYSSLLFNFFKKSMIILLLSAILFSNVTVVHSFFKFNYIITVCIESSILVLNWILTYSLFFNHLFKIKTWS